MPKHSQNITIDTETIVRTLLIITAFVGGIWLIFRLHRELIWIGVAFFLAVALDPPVTWIAKHSRGGRFLATAIVFIIFVAILSFVGASLVPPLVSQTEGLATQLPHFLERIQNSQTAGGRLIQHYDLVARAKQLQAHTLTDLTSGSGTALGIAYSVFNGVAATVTTLVLTFFMLLEGPRWATLGFRHVPVSEKSHYHRLSTKMYKIVAGYMTGNLIIAACVAILTAGFITLVGVPYAIPLGIFSGLTTLIPLIGILVALVVVCGVALFTSTTAALILAIYFIIYAFLDGHVLRPVVYGRTLQMSSLLVMVAIVLGTALDGLIGALVAIPLTACIGVLVSDLAADHDDPHPHHLTNRNTPPKA
jgi:predicted PurR-regulated permease PerM